MIDLVDNGSNKYEVSSKISQAIKRKFNTQYSSEYDRFYPVLVGGLKAFYYILSSNRAYTYNLLVLDSNLKIKVTKQSVKHEIAFHTREALFDLIIRNAEDFE